MSHSDIFSKIRGTGIVPVVKLDSPEQAVPLARALVAGDMPIAEVTFRTAAAEQAIKNINAEVPEILLGAGTVLTVEQAEKARAAGASFLVSPGFNPDVVKFAIDNNLPIVPGVNNPTQIEQALSFGLKTVKFFPAEQSGGLAMIKALSGPYGDINFMPTGGVDIKNMANYLAYEKITAIGGTWMVKPELINAGKFAEISRLAHEAVMAGIGFSLQRLAITGASSSAAEAEKIATMLGKESRTQGNSFILGNELELLSASADNKNQIIFKTLSVERALYYLGRRFNIKAISGSEKIKNSLILSVRTDYEISGFSVCLERIKS